MDMYEEFQKELYGRSVIKWPWGFASYEGPFEDGSLYIHSAFIKKSERKKGRTKTILKDLKKKYRVKTFSSYVDTTTTNYEQSIKAHLNAGYKVVDVKKDSVIFELNAESI